MMLMLSFSDVIAYNVKVTMNAMIENVMVGSVSSETDLFPLFYVKKVRMLLLINVHLCNVVLTQNAKVWTAKDPVMAANVSTNVM